MALSQMQTIQSLGNNLAILQQEVETFGVSATETRHLVGRIGELYTCVITNGQMALNTNEKGYDVVSSIGERISVKTLLLQPLVEVRCLILTPYIWSIGS